MPRKIKETREMNTREGRADGMRDFMFPGPPSKTIRAKTREEALKVYNKEVTK